MGFLNSLEKWVTNVENNAKKLDDSLEKWATNVENNTKKIDNWIDKNFPKEPVKNEEKKYSSNDLLEIIKRKFDSLFKERILKKAKSLRSSTSHFEENLSSNITYSKIEEITDNCRYDLSDKQYKILIKGKAAGLDDYDSLTSIFNFDVCIIIDDSSTYIVDYIKVKTWWD